MNNKKLKPKNTTGCLFGLIYGAAIIAVSVVIALFGWNAAKDFSGLFRPEKSVSVTISEDYTIPQLAKQLKEKGLIENTWLFSFIADFAHAERKIKPGTYSVRADVDYLAMINSMRPNNTSREEIRLSIPEGYTLRQMFALFEEKGVCKAEDLFEAVDTAEFNYAFLDGIEGYDRNRLEGFLFPDTYDFFLQSSPKSVFATMLNNYKRHQLKEYDARAEELGYSKYEILIIASMVEKESANDDDERRLIASVIYNRLQHPDRFPTLGIDATIQYILEKPHVNLTAAELAIDSPYNTRLSPGLPPTPICSPGHNAINAAYYPAQSNYYYYVLTPNGHAFAKTAAEFEALKRANQDYINSLG